MSGVSQEGGERRRISSRRRRRRMRNMEEGIGGEREDGKYEGSGEGRCR